MNAWRASCERCGLRRKDLLLGRTTIGANGRNEGRELTDHLYDPLRHG